MTDGCVHLQQQLEIPSARSWAAPIRATGTVWNRRGYDPSIKYKITLLQPARRAAMLGQTSSFRTHREQATRLHFYIFICTVLRFLPCTGKNIRQYIYIYVRGILCTTCVRHTGNKMGTLTNISLVCREYTAQKD
jgi:hypothetical protein